MSKHFDMLPIRAFSPVGFGGNKRMTLEGGGGGGGGDGGAGQRERERQDRIRAATDTINNIFNGSNRQSMYDEQRKAIYDLNSTEVNRQATEAERNNRFGLARNGLVGGSADIDSNAELNRRANEGLLQAGGIADQSQADLKAQDERTRSSLISMAQQGIDTGTAAQMALNGLSVNADNAAAARGGATIGNLFSDLSQAYLVNKMMQGQNAALMGVNAGGIPNAYGSQAPVSNGSGTSGSTQKNV